MSKTFTLLLAIIFAAVLFCGCRGAVQTADNNKTNSSARSDAAEQNVEAPVEKENGDSETERPRSGELPLEEIEAELGYGYILPDESLYTGTIVSKLEKPLDGPAFISLEYTADVFEGVVFATKRRIVPENAKDPAELWPELAESGTKTVDGLEVHFLGSSPYREAAAYWERDGFLYTVEGEPDKTPAMIPLVRLFSETGYLPIDPAQTVNAERPAPEEKTMEEIETELGYGYKLPDEGEYDGKITCRIEEAEGEKIGISLTYTLDDELGSQIYVSKRVDDGSEDEGAWDQFYEAGSEVVNGVEVHFWDVFEIPGHRSIAVWKQNGYRYVLNCAASAVGVDIMTVLPLFMENE